jgi:hypothetical protein
MNIKWLWLKLSFYQLKFESSKYQITEKNLKIFFHTEIQLAVRSDYVKERFFNILEATLYSYINAVDFTPGKLICAHRDEGVG